MQSEAKKDDISEEIAKYDGVWAVEAPQRQILKSDLGLVLKSKAKHAAISSRLNAPFVFKDSPLVVQYEVTMQEGQECGGAYLKLLSSGKETTDLKTVSICHLIATAWCFTLCFPFAVPRQDTIHHHVWTGQVW